MKKKLVRLISIALALIIVVSATSVLAACNKKTEARDENTVQISYTLAGYGDDWIYEAVDKFNEVYADKGYKAVIERSDAGFVSEKVMQEIKYPDDNPYDLYFTISENIVYQLMDASYSVLKDKDKALLEDLSDLYEMSPVALDGSEESGTVASTRNESMLSYITYINEGSKFNGKKYAYQWTSAYGGMAINKSVLAKYGYTEIPRTTKEIEAMFEYVLNNPQSANGNKIYPVTWAGQNAAGYVTYSLYTWIAQYMGLKGYENFFSMTPETGTTMANGYDVYDNVGILYALQTMEALIDQKYAMEGTVTTVDHLLSEQILADGEALFAFTGDWCYNELYGLGYTNEELSNIEMMPIPVLSEIADKIGLSGSADEKDAKLSAIIKGIDDGMTDAQIATAQGVTTEQVATVREARGMYYDLGYTHQAIIPSYSNAKGAAKEFLRFIASGDFSKNVFSEYAHGITANSTASSTKTNYLKSLSTICVKPYSQPIGEANNTSKIRMNGGISFTFEPMTSYVDMAKGMATNTTNYDAVTMYEKVKNAMKNNWATILVNAGMYDD